MPRVHTGELEGCQRICPPNDPLYAGVCECKTAEHDRAYQHRNLQQYADGKASILYAHADTWINLLSFRRLVSRSGNTTLSPRAGLQGTSYTPTPSKCFPHGPALDKTTTWFWHLDAKAECVAANKRMDASVLGRHGAKKWAASPMCCYGWADIAYIPRHAHAVSATPTAPHV